MKAAYISETGSPDVIQYGELPDPQIGESDVLVKVGAVAVNPIDTYLRAGLIPMPLTFPYIVGCDLAGTVEAVGSAATRFQPGARVWGSNQGLLGRPGTFAQYAAVNEQWLYPTPDEQTDAQAAGGALTGITAHIALALHYEWVHFLVHTRWRPRCFMKPTVRSKVGSRCVSHQTSMPPFGSANARISSSSAGE